MNSYAPPIVTSDNSLAQRFEAVARSHPDCLAVKMGGVHYSYAELDRRAEMLACGLESSGVEVGDIVGIYGHRHPDIVVAILATWKVGASYLPLDRSYPVERLEYMVADAAPRLILNCGEATQDIALRGVNTIRVDKLLPEDLKGPLRRRVRISGAEVLPAYCIYTSGSTGKPKGVVVSHQSVSALFEATSSQFHISHDDVWSMFHSYAFDFAVWEMLGALLYGGTLAIVPYELSRKPDEFVRFLIEQGVTVLNQTPSAFRRLINSDAFLKSMDSLSLRLVIFGGEALDFKMLSPLNMSNTDLVRFANMYGITEVTVHATVQEVTPSQIDAGLSVIGRPLQHLQCEVLDRLLSRSPRGIRGELYIEGAGVANGYLRRARLTADRFLPSLYTANPGIRLYRSGDLVIIEQDGRLRYIGRSDGQVKIRGFRVEIGEIEQAIASHPAVAEVAVRVFDEDTEKILLAFVELRQSGHAAVDDIMDYLGRTVPEHMLPADIILVESLPRTASGKLDKRALERPRKKRAPTDGPRSELERKLFEIWSEVLRVDGFSRESRFFELGGDSITSLRIVSRAKRASLHINARDMLGNPSISILAERVNSLTSVSAIGVANHGDIPLSPIQSELLSEARPDYHAWCQVVTLRVRVGTDLDKLLSGVLASIGKHESFRLRYRFEDPRWIQYIPEQPADCRQLYGIIECGAMSELQMHIQQLRDAIRIDTGPIINSMIAICEDQPYLVLCANHLVVDGVSWRILLEDIETYYSGSGTDEPDTAVAVEGTPFSVWATALPTAVGSAPIVEARRFWLNTARWRQRQPIAFDSDAQPTVQSAESLRYDLSPELAEKLLPAPGVAPALPIDECLFSALCMAVGVAAGTTRILVDVERHGRNETAAHQDLTQTTGWFTTRFPVAVNLSGITDTGQSHDGEWKAAVAELSRQYRNSVDRGFAYGALRLYGDPVTRYVLNRSRRTPIAFNYLGSFEEQFGSNSLFRASDVPGPLMGVEEDILDNAITLSVAVYENRIRVTWIYSSNVVNGNVVAKLAEEFSSWLDRLATIATMPPGNMLRLEDPQDHAAPAWSIRDLASEPYVETVPISAGQFRLWVVDRLDQELGKRLGGAYNLTKVLRISGGFNLIWLERSLDLVVAKHEILRTRYVEVEGEPTAIAESVTAGPRIIKTYELEEAAESHIEIEKIVREEAVRRANLSTDNVLRVVVIKESETRHVVILTLHHIAGDGWSMNILASEIAAAYKAFAGNEVCPTLPPLNIQYSDYAGWQRDYVSRIASGEAEFWRQYLKNSPRQLNLPIGDYRSRTPSYEANRVHSELSQAEVNNLDRFAREHGLTLHVVLMGTLFLLLHRETREPDLVIGTDVACRTASTDLEYLIGFFVNVLPIRSRAEGRIGIVEYLVRLHADMATVMEHQEFPFDQIVNAVGAPRSTSRNALVQLLFVMNNQPHFRLESDGLTIEVQDPAVHYTKFDLSVFSRRLNGIVEVEWLYRPDIFVQVDMAKLARQYLFLVNDIAAGNIQSLDIAPESHYPGTFSTER